MCNVDRRGGPRPYYILPIVLPTASTQSPGTVTLRMSPYPGQEGSHGRRISGRTVGKPPARDGETPQRGVVLPGACPYHKSRTRGGLSPVISMLLHVERGLKCGGGEWARLKCCQSPHSPLLRLPHPALFTREIGAPWCMIRFLISRLAATPRGTCFASCRY